MAFSRWILCCFLLVVTSALLYSPAAWAQTPEAPQAQPAAPHEFQQLDYSQPRSHFPNPIRPYEPRYVPAPNLSNTPRVDQLMHNGKLMLSIDDAVALALENNLDLVIARYTLNIADTDILRAKAGAPFLGVNTGIVQNTPGGGVGGLGNLIGTGSGPGGTTEAQGGAAAGLGGIVGSTLGLGPVVASFDPILTGTMQLDHARFECSSIFCGTAQNTGTANFAYSQGFITGTNMLVGFNNSRITSNNPFTTISPDIASNFKFQLTQHLLQGLGFAPNTRYLRIAKNDREISDVAFRMQVTTTVDQIENIYWDLVYAYEYARVQRENLAFAEKTLSDTKKQVDIGTLAPIEVVRAQNTVATDQQNVTLSQTNLELEQLLMKNALSRTLQDPVLAGAEVVPTSTMNLPAQEPVVPTEDLVNDALAHRPEVSIARINLTNTEISKKAIRSALLPSLDLFAYYGGSGLGGAQNPSSLCANQPLVEQEAGFCTGFNQATGTTTIPAIAPVGYGSTLNQLVNSSAPDKGAGLTLNIPLRNRAAQALQLRSELEYRQAQVRTQQIENLVRIEVRNAQFAVQQDRAAVQAAEAAVTLGRQSLDAEQKKYALGASTTTLVLQQQSQLATAESTFVSATATYEKSRVELDRATGLLLDHLGIDIAEAQRGQVTRMPTVPYVAPRTETPTTAAPAQTEPTAPAQPEQPAQQPQQQPQPSR